MVVLLRPARPKARIAASRMSVRACAISRSRRWTIFMFWSFECRLSLTEFVFNLNEYSFGSQDDSFGWQKCKCAGRRILADPLKNLRLADFCFSIPALLPLEGCASNG
jgi:hypothetical protein